MVLKITRSEFVRSVATLMTGTVIAQLISFLIYPLLTRIYTPDQMGDLGIFTRLVTFISVLATARYELTIPIAKNDAHAFLLYRLSFKITIVVLVTFFIIGIIYYLFNPTVNSTVGFVLLVLLTSYLTVWINLGSAWSIRRKLFKQIAIQRIVNAVSVNSLRVLFGVMNLGTLGLLFGTFLGVFLSIIVFIRTFFTEKREFISQNQAKKFYVLAKQYNNFPMINLPHALLDLGVEIMISTLIIYFFDKENFGFYSFSYLMMRVPLALIGQSIGQVFFNRCSETFNGNNSIFPLVVKTMRTLFMIGLVPFMVLFFWGEPLFQILFGKVWSESGRIVEILSLTLFLNFIISPISTIPLILNKQKQMFIIGIIAGIIHLISFGILPLVSKQLTFEKILVVNAVLLSVLHLVTGYIYFKLAKKN